MMMKYKTSRSSEVPQWAQDLIAEVCRDYSRRMPPITWYNSSNEHSSGRTGYPHRVHRWGTGKVTRTGGRIHITAGTSLVDQRLVVLHELAHWIVVRSKNQGHTAKFWDTAFDLYSKYGDIDYAQVREFKYREGAKLAFARRSK